MLSRRSFLSNSALALGAAGLAPLSALAADQTGYKALVCVFLFGGADSHDMLIGYDQPSYDQWATARESILNLGFAETSNPGARSRENLLQLAPLNQGDFGSRSFAMPAEMQPIKDLFDQGQLAIVPNVGPLIEPVTQQQIVDGTARVPGRLQSHNDQQSTWQAFLPEGAQTGWGGLVLDAMNQASDFAAVSAAGQTVFLNGDTTRHLQIGDSQNIGAAWGSTGTTFGSTELSSRIREWYSSNGLDSSHPMMRDIIRAQGKAVADAEVAKSILENQTLSDRVRIRGNPLSFQLGTIADCIAARQALGVNRQVFFAALGGWDTHSDHARTVPGLLETLSAALMSFQTALNDAGLGDQVTTFTSSDFGRTLTANASGTDHGWGGHHFVMGGAVRGQRIHGSVPSFEAGHDRDFKRGALIPDISVEQYGAALARWFGLSESELDAAFPSLGNFDRNALQLFT